MPLTLMDSATEPNLDAALGVEGEKEYTRLLRAIRMAEGRYFIFPIESDFQMELRTAMLDRLRTDLTAINLRLRVLTLTETCWDIFSLLEQEEPIQQHDVVVLLGLENTPKIVQEPGAEPQRPPAIATLNIGREALRTKIPAPFLVWCLPFVYTALIQQGPDFFDHYSSIFEFLSAQPQSSPSQQMDGIPGLSYIDDHAPASHAAIDFYRKKLATLAEPTPERADALLDLAGALLDLRQHEHAKHIAAARQLTEEAIHLLAKRRNRHNRQQWARGQVLLGLSFSFASTGDRSDNFKRAVACYEAALQIYTHDETSHQWAMTQGNLGNAYSDLPTGDRSENFKRALACYEAALQVYTQKETPYDWAMIQNNLGVAYRNLPTGDRAENLEKAIACYEAALQVFTKQETPYDWSHTHFNLALAYVDNAREAMQQARNGYQSIGMEQDAQMAEIWLQRHS